MSDVEVTDEDKAAAVVAFRRLLGFDPMPLLSKSDSAVMQTLQEFHAQARAAGKAEGRRERLSQDDEELVAAVACAIGETLKHQPHMGGNCRVVHGEVTNRRSARAAIRAITARSREGSDK